MTIPNLPVVKNSLEAYLSQINQFQLLTQEEEFKLAVRYRKHNDIEAAHKLITANLRFVVKVAFEYKSYGVKLQDLVQEGNIGLMTCGRFGRVFPESPRPAPVILRRQDNRRRLIQW